MPPLAPFRPGLIAVPLIAALALAACQPQATLDLSNQGQVYVDECILEECTTLRLDHASLTDYGQVARLHHVTELMLSSTSFSDLSDLAGMTQLTALHFGNSRVRDLSGLAALPNLRLLHMQGIDPVSWGPVTRLPALEELAVGTFDLRDLSFVAGLPGLKRLHLAQVDERLDLATLGAHPGLRAVHLGDADGMSSIPDLSPLLQLPNLREVSVYTLRPEDHAQAIAALRARGVRVTLTEPVIIVC